MPKLIFQIREFRNFGCRSVLDSLEGAFRTNQEAKSIRERRLLRSKINQSNAARSSKMVRGNRRPRSNGMLPLLALHAVSEYYRLDRKPPVTYLRPESLIYLRPAFLDPILPTIQEVGFNPHLILKGEEGIDVRKMTEHKRSPCSVDQSSITSLASKRRKTD